MSGAREPLFLIHGACAVGAMFVEHETGGYSGTKNDSSQAVVIASRGQHRKCDEM